MSWRSGAWAAIVLSSAFQIAKHFMPETGADPLWDLHVYVRAMDSPNPYDLNGDLLFVYAPMVADVFRLARSHLFEVLMSAYVLSIVWFTSEYARVPLRRRGGVFLMALATGGMGTVSIMSGNITVFMHLATLAAAMRTERLRSSTWPLLALIAIFSLVKPYFIVLMPLALVLSANRRREIVRIAIAGVVVAGIFGLYLLWRPAEMRAFFDALDMQLVRRGDSGSSVLAALIAPLGMTAATMVFAVFVVVLGVAARTTWSSIVATGSYSALLYAYALLCLVNPRAQIYDLFPVLLCLVMLCDLRGWPIELELAVMAASLIGAVPVVVREFARDPMHAAPLLLDYRIAQLTAIAIVLIAIVAYFPMQNRSKI